MDDKKTSLNILVIEDHQDLAENIGDYLTAMGHIVDFGMDGISGMHLALTQSFDVIILDLMLPGMDGITLCKKYREEVEGQTPILMLTARDSLDDSSQALSQVQTTIWSSLLSSRNLPSEYTLWPKEV